MFCTLVVFKKNIMKIFLPLFTFTLILTSLSAQITTDWQFNDAGGYNYYPTTNIINDGTNTFICSQSLDPLKVAYIYKLNASGNLIAQDSIHNFDYSILDHKRMIRDNSGAIYLCGNKFDASSNSTIRLIKFDDALNRIWDVAFTDSNTQSSSATGLLYSAFENKMYVVGDKYDSTDHNIILKYDTSGNLLWESNDTLSNSLSLTSYTIDHIGNVIQGGYAFINGFGTAEDFVIYKTDTSGVLSWLVRENGSFNSDDMVADLCVDFENNIYASGIFGDSVRNKIFKYSPAGNQIWTRSLPEIYFTKVASDPAGGLYIVGLDTVSEHEFTILKYDSTGNFIHSSYSDLPNFNSYNQDYFLSIQTNDSANVYLLNSADSSGQYKWIAAKLDSALNMKWNFVYPDVSPNSATAGALCLVDDGIIAAGRIDNFISVVHFTETFATLSENNFNAEQVSVWPNPSKDFLNIMSKFLRDETLELKVYDIHSRLLIDKLYTNVGTDYLQLNISGFKSGLYFLTFQTKGKTYKTKFIIEN